MRLRHNKQSTQWTQKRLYIILEEFEAAYALEY